MSAPYSTLSEDRIIWQGTVISFSLLIIAIVLIAIFYLSLPPIVPVYNQLPWGEDRLGQKVELFVPIFTAIIIFVLNITFANAIYEKMPLLARMLSITTLFICLVTCVFTIRTLLLVL